MNKIFKKLINLFLQGLLLVLPLWLSGYLIYSAIAKVDSVVDLGFPGGGVLIVLGGITMVGYLLSQFVTEQLYDWFTKLLEKIPIFKLIYGSIRDLMEAFVGEQKKFTEPVLVDIGHNAKRIGFVTQKDLSKIRLETHVAVYFPFSYTFTGEILIIDKTHISKIDTVNGAEMMKFIVGGGVGEL